MLLALALSFTVLHAKPPPGPGPSAYESAKLFFLAGDLAAAQEWARRGLKREPKTCGPLNKQLAEYNFLAANLDELTPEQARDFLALDRAISPTVRGKITEKAFQHYVVKPLELARSQAKGDVPRALQLLEQVLFVDPKNADALALKTELNAPGKDAGR